MWSALGAGASVNAKGHWPKMLARPNWSVRVYFANQADEGDCRVDVVTPGSTISSAVLVHEQHVLEHRQVGDGLLGLERPP